MTARTHQFNMSSPKQNSRPDSHMQDEQEVAAACTSSPPKESPIKRERARYLTTMADAPRSVGRKPLVRAL